MPIVSLCQPSPYLSVVSAACLSALWTNSLLPVFGRKGPECPILWHPFPQEIP
jgi:hypothetical protein